MFAMAVYLAASTVVPAEPLFRAASSGAPAASAATLAAPPNSDAQASKASDSWGGLFVDTPSILASWFLDAPLAYKWLYLSLMVRGFRYRYYFVWTCGHTVAVCSGFAQREEPNDSGRGRAGKTETVDAGAKKPTVDSSVELSLAASRPGPAGLDSASPQDGAIVADADSRPGSGRSTTIARTRSFSLWGYDRTQNVRMWRVETATNITELSSSWNTQTSLWLKHYVYARVHRPAALRGVIGERILCYFDRTYLPVSPGADLGTDLPKVRFRSENLKGERSRNVESRECYPFRHGLQVCCERWSHE